jgi:23S rRNA (guanosine2251-2'-O)-methyltransferase
LGEGIKTLCGRRTVEEYLRNEDRSRLVKLFLSKANRPDANKSLIDLASAKGVPFALLDAESFRKRAGDIEHSQGVLLTVEKRSLDEDAFLDHITQSSPRLVLLLDHLEDPANLGSILRTCGFYGCDTVVVPQDRSVSVTPAVEKIASGALSTVGLYEVVNLNRILDKLKEEHGYWAVATVMSDNAEDLHSFDFPKKTVLAVGNEHQGLSALTDKKCDFRVRIRPGGAVGSLNAAVATAIFLDRFYGHKARTK